MIFRSLLPGSGGIQLALADDGLSVITKWTDKTLDPHMHGVVLLDGCIYVTAQSANKGLVCLVWKTGKVIWNDTVYFVKPDSGAFKPVSQFAVTGGTNEHWAHPTIANRRLYIRQGDALMAYDIKAGS